MFVVLFNFGCFGSFPPSAELIALLLLVVRLGNRAQNYPFSYLDNFAITLYLQEVYISRESGRERFPI